MQPAELPLFPLGTVLFPEGVLRLKVFEARYLDLMSRCVREGSPFGVVGLLQGLDVLTPSGGAVQAMDTEMAHIGTSATLLDVDMAMPGVMHIRAQGQQRFYLRHAWQGSMGLWTGRVEWIDPEGDAAEAEPKAMLDPDATQDLADCANALKPILRSFQQQGIADIGAPRWQDASWVAARWAELLPNPVAQKAAVLELNDPTRRLALVRSMLRAHGVVN